MMGNDHFIAGIMPSKVLSIVVILGFYDSDLRDYFE